MKIYVASSWRNQFQPQIVSLLREAGHSAYDFRNPGPERHGFGWEELNEKWKEWTPDQFRRALEHPIANAGFKSDFEAMQWADACVLILPCGRSAHSEAGYMAGQQKPVHVLMLDRQEPELMYKMFDSICISRDELLDTLMEQEIANQWLCTCGYFIEDGSCHCPQCHREAPWGCEHRREDEITDFE